MTLSDCQLLLYIIAERYPSSRKYRDLFERIKSSLVQGIANGGQHRHSQIQLDPDAQENFRGVIDGWPQYATDEFAQMLSDITGQLPDPLAGFTMPGGTVDMSSNTWAPT